MRWWNQHCKKNIIMNQLISNYNKLYPLLSASAINGTCHLKEPLNKNSSQTLYEVEITNVTGWEFPKDLPNKASSFYKMTHNPNNQHECHKILREDCDGIICCENGDKLTIYIFELKSSYTTDSIPKAKDQISGSYVKLINKLRTLQGFDPNKIEIIGVIIAYQLSTEAKSAMKIIQNRKARFCLQLESAAIYNMPKNICENYWNPIIFQHDILIKYIAVPNNQKSHTIDFSKIA